MAPRPRKYELGDPIDIHCEYCKLNLNGVVSAVVRNRPVKVQCRTCRNFQDYHPPLNEALERQRLLKRLLAKRDRHASPAPSKPRRTQQSGSSPDTALDQSAVARRIWDMATKDANPLKSRVYDPHLTFHKDDLISHPQLGLGVVSTEGDDSVVVLFREGFKRLEHNRPREEE